MKFSPGVLAVCLATACASHPPQPAPIRVFDGHLDTLIHYIGEDGTSWNDASSYDLTQSVAGQVDLARLREGGVAGALFTVGVLDPADREVSLAESIGVLRELEQRSQGGLRLVGSSDELERAMEFGTFAAVPAIEGGDQIGESLRTLTSAYALGVRSMGLTWEKTNAIGDSNADQPRHDGLSAFGRDVVAEMNRLGMIIDLSHAAQSTAVDVLSATTAPVILSHSSAAALCDTPRNASDELLADVARNGGVVMISFVPYLTNCEYRAWYLRGEEKWQELESQHGEDSPAAQAEMAEWERTHPAPLVGLAQVADHVEHVRRIAGVDHIGIGSDFDGMYSHVQGLEDASRTSALLEELANRGWTRTDLEKLAAGNFLRVWRQVEAAASK